MLGWLISAAAPWLIHLWSRRRRQRTSWAAMEYLLAALRETQRRLLLEEWTLLAVRTALIVAVVTAAVAIGVYVA
ncbi:MAG TPA: BatA domain-containing protein, partial [Thermoguttaceae bacterium]|nr:BatA domain-containing protein [Thermoguttaceae bacterium]